MIRQEQGKRNHHKEEILIRSSTTHAMLRPSTGSAVEGLFSTFSLPTGLDWQNPIFACWQLSSMPWFNMHCASVPGWKKTTNLTVFKSAY